MLNYLAVFIGGGLGSLLRYFISLKISEQDKFEFPVATFLSNTLSCFLLAFFFYLLKEKLADQSLLKVLLIVGFCGGFSTFSSFSLETITLLKNGNTYYALANVFISLLTCLGIVYLIYPSLSK